MTTPFEVHVTFLAHADSREAAIEQVTALLPFDPDSDRTHDVESWVVLGTSLSNNREPLPA